MSGFIEEINSDLLCFDWAKPVGTYGSTCECYVVQIDGKRFFMKRLRQEHINNQAYRALFRKEYEKGISMSHPNLVRYEKLIDSDDGCYILMENIVGETLDTFIENHPNYFDSRAHLDKFFNQLLSALKCLHKHHVVYSDLKPQNIMLTQINNDVKIVDLGFCFTDSYPDSAGTTSGFSAPEHHTKGNLDVTTDIFGVGKIIEYIGKNSAHNLPAVYAKIMLHCLKKRQQDRIQSTDEIVRLINKRRHLTRRVMLSIIVLVAMFFAYKTLIYDMHFNSWWDSFQIITPHVDYDTEFRHTYYSVLSEQNGTCAAVGHSSLPNVYLHDSIPINGKIYRLTHIADSAFRNKHYIKSVFIPNGILSIGIESFIGCKNLLTINLPNSITSIGDYAFHSCNGLRHLKLSTNITMIPKGAFAGCKFTEVTIPEGVTEIRLDAFGNCSELKEVDMPSTLTRIERGVFWNCESLQSIDIPAQVTLIGEYLFYGCDKLTDIYNFSVEPQVILPIHRNPAQITLHVPAESVDAYRNAPYWQDMNIVAIEK